MNMKKILFLFSLIITFFVFKLNVIAYDRTIDDGVYIIHSSINDNYVLDANGASIEANFTNNIISKYNLNSTPGIYYDFEGWY